MPRKKILWLCSWYPSKTEPFNGDFVQRHARAAALYNDIYVIHVTGDTSGSIKNTEKEISSSAGLTEHIVYYKKTSSFWGRLRSHYRWLALSRQAIRRYIVGNGKPDLVHVHIPIKAGLAALWMKRKYKVPFLVTEHWGIYNDVLTDNYAGKPATFKRYTKQVLDKAAGFISVSKYLAEGVNRLVTKKDYSVIPNVVDSKLFHYQDKQTAPFHFIHVSNMVPLKNTGGILHAFKSVLEENNKAVLVMVGDTDPSTRDKAKELGIPAENVLFLGEVPYEQVAARMQGADCLVLFSDMENSPCVIGEALCCGLPVIATDVGGIPELVDKNNAILVGAKDEKALAAAMMQVMDNYGSYDRKKIAEDAAGIFSYPVVGKKIDDIYRSQP